MTTDDLLTDPLLGSVPEHEGYKVLGGVVLYQKLGQGGMGAVYRGRHIRLQMDVAVKIMTPPPGVPPEAADRFIQRFLREARTAANIRHQNLVRVIDVNAEGGVYYLIMDYVDGESAGDRLERRAVGRPRRLAEQEAVEIALGAAEGLAEAHRRGIVHRDVKPDNILIAKDGSVVVADLGLAKAFGTGEGDGAVSMVLSVSQQAMGTPFYMSPEQTRSAKDVGPATDVWSLGATLYQLLTGDVPWRVTDLAELIMRIRNEEVPDLKGRRPDVSDGLYWIVVKSLAKDPASRYTDCSEMARALRAHLDSVRASHASSLPDAEAGMTNLAIVSVTPPPMRTLTLIAEAALERPLTPAVTPLTPSDSRRARATAATEAVSPPSRGWVLPVAIVGAALLVLAGVVVALLAGRGGGPTVQPVTVARDPLETEAERFYQEQSEAAASGRHAEVVAAIKEAAGKYDNTPFGMRIKRLGEAAAAQVAKRAGEKEREEAERSKNREAFEKALAAAGAAEKKGDLAGAVRQLKLALQQKDDPAVRERVAGLERRMRLDRLLAEAAGREKAKKWAEALAKYEEALPLAEGGKRQSVRDRVAELKKRVRLEELYAAAAREERAGNLRKAFELVREADKVWKADPRVEALSRKLAKSLTPQKSATGPLGIELVLVRDGSFKMGNASGARDEKPVHEVRISTFYIGRHEVTKAQFDAYRRGSRAVSEAGPASSRGKAREPVVSVSWQEAVEFCRYLTSIDPTRATYRLPAEAEWEFAARGPEGRAYPWGSARLTSRRANTKGKSDGYDGLAPVGSFPAGATPSGIHDMAGNAAEWCADWAGGYSAGVRLDPTGPVTGSVRVVRGGSFAQDSRSARPTARASRSPDRAAYLIGFRVVRELTGDEREFERMVAE